MREVAMRGLLPVVLLALAGTIPGPAAAREATAIASTSADAETARSARRSVRHWKQDQKAVSRRPIKPQGRARAYRRQPLGPAFDWNDLTLQCLLSQPFVICP